MSKEVSNFKNRVIMLQSLLMVKLVLASHSLWKATDTKLMRKEYQYLR